MNAYHLVALPPILLTVAVPQLWPWALAVETTVLLLLVVDAREDRLDRRARMAEEPVAKRWVDLGAFAAWSVIGCDKAEQYPACEEIARAVLQTVMPVRDADRDEAARMEARLTDPATATTVRVPLLRAVSGDPAVAEWAAVLRATGDR